ncbi:hypothetical protein DSO57_1028040 [Entomophthora muscae]|uniref:Uncharacterized protein n=1 Tax=Entomophthora muscae TaxID=34485 RepID=A0ACC2UBX7_9FUNG|nr:hypothetical protein DSO57_1028040 [Entomophthora muscae]
MYDQFTSQLPDPRLYNDILQAPASGDEDASDMLNLGKMENTRDILATENIVSAIRLLNYELAHFGYPPIKVDPESEGSHQLVQTFFALLGQQHTSRSFREEYEDRMHRLIFDHKHAVNSVARLKEKLDLSLRESESLKLELKEATREIKNEKEKVRLLQEDLKQTRSNHLHAKSQFAHDLRKKDVEVTRAKERTQKIIADKYKAAKLGLTALNPPPQGAIIFLQNNQ